MTTVTERLQTALNSLATGGASSDVNDDQPPPSEYIIFTNVVSPANVSMQGSSDLQNTRVQIDVYATTRLRTLAIDALILPALQAAGFTAVVELESQHLFDAETRRRRITHDFSVWAR